MNPMKSFMNIVHRDTETRSFIYHGVLRISLCLCVSVYFNLNIAAQIENARWIGAISKKEAKIPTGRWSNAVFKQDTFKIKWQDVDSLSARSIIVKKDFQAKGKIAKAEVDICGLGHYELTINGQKVGDSEFAPLWSEYDKTVYYNRYNVTELLRKGQNRLETLLGNGMFNVQRGARYSKLQQSFGPPQLLLRLVITYHNGKKQIVESDGSWQWCLSPITFNSIYGGESYDASLERKETWKPVVYTEGPKGTLRLQTAPPVKIMERYDVKSWKYILPDSIDAASKATKRTIPKGAFVCDMGQNLAGFPEITVSGKPGQKITLLVSEKLTPQGACDQRQTGRQHYYEYTIGSYSPSSREGQGGGSSWHPRFSYYGFRYIQVEGAVFEGEPNPEELPVLHKLQSCFIYNSAPEVSSFECSNELFTKTHRLIERAERSNMQAVLTDCPHREKLGWLEQDHLNGPSLLYNYDLRTYVPKIIQDIVDTQKSNGMVPTTAPQYVSFGNLFDDSPEWGSTLIILPFMYYDQYGDSTLIMNNYESMSRYVDYLTTRADSGIVSHGLGDWYDQRGTEPGGFTKNTPVPLVATAHYLMDLRYVAQAARMEGNATDAKKYDELADFVTKRFNEVFYHTDSCYYGTGSQCSNALPLFLGICPDKEAVLQNLISDIRQHGTRLTTGDVGNRYLFQVLAENGQNELLFEMLNHNEAPGYGYQIKAGATTLTEQWMPENGSSQNHFMMGQADEWLFKSIAGIRQQKGTHGMRHLLIAPQLVGNLQWVKASTMAATGRVSVHATRDNITVEIPEGCDAELIKMNGERKFVMSGKHTF